MILTWKNAGCNPPDVAIREPHSIMGFKEHWGVLTLWLAWDLKIMAEDGE